MSERNYKLTISYDGTKYYGWEHQPDRETIQGKIETVLTRMVDADDIVDVIGAGRTDAGVHAKAMVANTRLDTSMSCDEIRDYMNRYLPDDIAIQSVKEASDNFHARYKAVGKTYVYTCYDGPVKPVFNRKYYTYIDDGELDVTAMEKAAVYLMGEHDYKSFCGNSHMKKSTVRIVDEISIKRSKGYVYFSFHGTGFLQNMVRIMTGTLIEVGLHRMKPSEIPGIIEARDRKMAGPTAPAKGLCLEKVDY